jgi:hypothetical protein
VHRLDAAHLFAQALDGWPAQRAAGYVGALLVANGALPSRDEALARLERDTAALLASVSNPDDRRTLTAYARWRVMRRARGNARHRPGPPHRDSGSQAAALTAAVTSGRGGSLIPTSPRNVSPCSASSWAARPEPIVLRATASTRMA